MTEVVLDDAYEIALALIDGRNELKKAERDDAWAEVAKDLLERGLTKHLIQVAKPAPKELDDFTAFVTECREQGVTPIPCSPFIVAMHLAGRIYESSARAVVRAAAAIDSAHDCMGYAPPSGHSSVRAVLKFNKEHPRKAADDGETRH